MELQQVKSFGIKHGVMSIVQYLDDVDQDGMKVCMLKGLYRDNLAIIELYSDGFVNIDVPGELRSIFSDYVYGLYNGTYSNCVFPADRDVESEEEFIPW